MNKVIIMNNTMVGLSWIWILKSLFFMNNYYSCPSDFSHYSWINLYSTAALARAATFRPARAASIWSLMCKDHGDMRFLSGEDRIDMHQLAAQKEKFPRTLCNTQAWLSPACCPVSCKTSLWSAGRTRWATSRWACSSRAHNEISWEQVDTAGNMWS